MDRSPPSALRGFDSYEVKLGDELRGHRATRGKSLLDVQRDLRIRAAYIDAIENCDPSVIPNKGFVAGYVRAYARYLGLTPDEIFARFCAESGFSSGAPARAGGAPRSAPELNLSRSHFASPVGRAGRAGLGVSMSAIASILVVAGLVGGLGWGGWTLLQEIQRVEFAPGNESPQVAVAPAGIALPTVSITSLSDIPQEQDRSRDAALTALYAPQEQGAPALALRDGPIGDIDPDTVGVFANAAPTERRETPMRLAATAVIREGAAQQDSAAAAAGAPLEGADLAAAAAEIAAAASKAADALPAPKEKTVAVARTGTWLVAADPAWLQVRLADGSTLVQRIFQRGDRFQLPDDLGGARLRAGNAGSVYIEIDGVLHGPLGAPGGVVKRVSLTADEVRARFETVAADPFGPAEQPDLRAEASLTLD